MQKQIFFVSPDDGNTDNGALSPKLKITLACSQFCVLLYYIIALRKSMCATTIAYVQHVVQHDIFVPTVLEMRARQLNRFIFFFRRWKRNPLSRKSAQQVHAPTTSQRPRRRSQATTE